MFAVDFRLDVHCFDETEYEENHLVCRTTKVLKCFVVSWETKDCFCLFYNNSSPINET